MRYFIGIDGGGTKCRARLRGVPQDGQLGELLGEGMGGPANIRIGLDLAWGHILEAIDGALAQARLNRSVFSETALGLGLAGITSARDVQMTIQAGLAFGYAQAASDAHAACLGAFSGRNGAIMITGTGSAGYAWVEGVGHAVGGWGFEINDDGSAASLGRSAIRAAVHGFDGLTTHTAFTRAVMAHFGGHPADIVAWVNQAGPSDFGTLAPIVMQYAGEGDAVAVELVEASAQDIGRYLARLHALGAPKLCLVGGMAESLMPWLAPWTRTILTTPEHDAVEGAIMLAHGAPNGMPERLRVGFSHD
ncbi:MAG: BadF/BadG/BcrA/BcrD ATPase family protein [Asticcacaulis sp.]